jgi:hypothetical protein
MIKLKFMMCKRNKKENVEYKTFIDTLNNIAKGSAWAITKAHYRLDENLFEDYNHKGYMTLDDFKEMNKHLKFKDDIQKLYNSLDKSGNGKISKDG